jgi:hypothetical protein
MENRIFYGKYIMSHKVKIVDIATEDVKQEAVEEKPIEEAVAEPGKTIQPPREEESDIVATSQNEDEVNIKEIIKEEAEKPRETLKTKERKTVVCPKCSKVLLEKNYEYSHQAVCGKVKTKPVIEEAVQEPTPKPKPATVEELPPPPPAKPTYWEMRREYNNHLRERKQQLVKKLVSKAF